MRIAAKLGNTLFEATYASDAEDEAEVKVRIVLGHQITFFHCLAEELGNLGALLIDLNNREVSPTTDTGDTDSGEVSRPQ
jgi:hypothetical protein